MPRGPPEWPVGWVGWGKWGSGEPGRFENFLGIGMRNFLDGVGVGGGAATAGAGRETVVLELPWPPVTGNRATRHTSRGHYRLPEAKTYRGAVSLLAGRKNGSEGGCRPLAGPLHVDWLLFPPDRRARDHTNVLKEVEDAITAGGLWADDSNKVIRSVYIRWGDPVPGGKIILTISQY